MTMPGNFRALRARARRMLIAVIGAAVPLTAMCQTDDGAGEVAADEIRHYTVELVIFEYAPTGASDREIFVPDPLPTHGGQAGNAPRVYGDPGTSLPGTGAAAADDEETYDEDALDFLTADEPQLDETVEEIPNHIIQTQLKLLDPAEYAMKDIYRKLVELDAYRPVMRAAWTQATFDEQQTLPIRLRRLGNAPLRLDGTVKLYLSRYLHFVVDLTLEAPAEQREQSRRRDDGRTRYYGDRRSSRDYGFGYDEPVLPVKYRINEDRIFRSGELRYFDHPKFGVLARVTRVEEEEPATDEAFLLPGN